MGPVAMRCESGANFPNRPKPVGMPGSVTFEPASRNLNSRLTGPANGSTLLPRVLISHTHAATNDNELVPRSGQSRAVIWSVPARPGITAWRGAKVSRVEHPTRGVRHDLRFRFRPELVVALSPGRQPDDIREPGFGGGAPEARVDLEAVGGE